MSKETFAADLPLESLITEKVCKIIVNVLENNRFHRTTKTWRIMTRDYYRLLFAFYVRKINVRIHVQNYTVM